MSKTYTSRESGFTITELSLAMTMLTVLMMIILLSILNIISVYNKGITLKRVNQSGATISHALQSSLRTSSLGNVRAVTQQLGATTTVHTRMCTGVYSFIWSVYGDGDNAIETFSNGNEITFIKIRDSGAQQCASSPPQLDQDDPNVSILLGDGLVVRPPTNVTISNDQKLIQAEYTISTPEGEDIIYDGTGRASCQGGSDDDFCALNTFVVTSYAKGI